MFVSRMQYLANQDPNLDIPDAHASNGYLIVFFVLGFLFLVRGVWVYVAARRAVRRMMSALPMTMTVM